MKFQYKKACQCGIKAFVIVGLLGTACLLNSCSDEDKAPDSDRRQPAPVKAKPAVEVQPEPVVQSSSTSSGSNSFNTMMVLAQEADAALTEMLTLLEGIKSKQSADAALPRLRDAYNRLNRASAELEKMNLNMSEIMNAPEDELDKLERIGTRLKRDSAVLLRLALRISMRDCYGSTELSNFLDEME